MQLPLVSPLASSAVLATLLIPQPAADTVVEAQPQTAGLPLTSPCPAYVGPQCDSVEHEELATGQAIVAMDLDS